MGLEVVRRGTSENAFLAGCGSPFGPAVGIVDAMRVSPDVSPTWTPPTVCPGSTRRRRRPQRRRHCRCCRPRCTAGCGSMTTTACCCARSVRSSARPNGACWLRQAAGAGGFVMASDDLASYREEEWELLAAARAMGAVGDGPLELVDRFAETLHMRFSALLLTVDTAEPPRSGPARGRRDGGCDGDRDGTGWLAEARAGRGHALGRWTCCTPTAASASR